MAIGPIEIFIVLLMYAIPLIVVVYLIILAKRYADAKAEKTKKFTDFEDKIARLSESIDRIEKKLDKSTAFLIMHPRGMINESKRWLKDKEVGLNGTTQKK